MRLDDVRSFLDRGGAERRRLERRKRIQGLPEDWRLRFAQALPSQHRLPFLVMAATGCRPSELAQGILVCWRAQHAKPTRACEHAVSGAVAMAGGDSPLAAPPMCFTFAIQGTKITDAGGQTLRHLAIAAQASKPGADLCGALYLELTAYDGRGLMVSCSVRALDRVIRITSLRLWPDRPALSAYSLRYQFADDARRQAVGRDALARALGHASTASQNAYTALGLPVGRARATPAGPLLTSASRAIRSRADRLDRLERSERENAPERTRERL